MSLFMDVIALIDRRAWVIGVLGFSFALFAMQVEPVIWIQQLWKVYAIFSIIIAIMFSPPGRTSLRSSMPPPPESGGNER